MSTKVEKDKVKQLQDKCQSVLNGLLKDEDNKYCVDCDSKGPRWASWNIGVFLCIRCAGIHRNLGVHISKVKSVNLDTWTPEQVVSLQQMGNSRARAVYEANLPDNFRRPQTDSSLESFIRAKYEHKKYIAREWVPLPLPKVNWEKEIDEEIEKQKTRKKKTAIMDSGSRKNLEVGQVPQLPKPKNPSPKVGRVVAHPTSDVKKDSGLSHLMALQNGGGEDAFSGFLSAAPKSDQVAEKSIVNNANVAQKSDEEESFFNQTVPTEKEKVQLTKDSILALYSNTPAPNFNFNNVPINPHYNMAGNFMNTHNFSGINPNAQFANAHQPQQWGTFPNQQQQFGGFPQTAPQLNNFQPNHIGVNNQMLGQQFGGQFSQPFANNPSNGGSFGPSANSLFQGHNSATPDNQVQNQNGFLQQQFENLTLGSQKQMPTAFTNIWQ